MKKDLGKLTDRQLLEAVYLDLSDRLERIETKVESVGVQAAAAVAATNRTWTETEKTAARLDAVITDLRDLTTKVRASISESRAVQKLARERIQDVERRLAAIGD